MEILTFLKFKEYLPFLRKRNLSKCFSSFNTISSCLQTIVVTFLFLLSISISAQKSASQEDKIYLAVDNFIANPSAENLNELALFSEKISPKLNVKNKDELLAFVILNCNKGYFQNQFGKTNQAISSYEIAWSMYQTNSLKNYDIVEFCLKPLGNLYTITGDFENAENTIKQYYYIATQTSNIEQQYAAVLNLSNVYQNTGRVTAAIYLLEKTVTTLRLTDSQKGNLYNNLGSNYFLNTKPTIMQPNAFENAEKAFLKAVTLLKNDVTQNEALVTAYRNLSKLKLERNEPAIALQYFDKAKIAFRTSATTNPRKKAQFFYDEANILFTIGNIKEATAIITKIFKLLIPNYSNQKTVLPNKEALYAETVLLDVLDLQAAIYNTQKQPEKALDSYALSFHIEELFQSLLLYENSKIISQVRNRTRTEKCISIYESLFIKEKKNSYLESAFLLSEKTKSAVLRSSLENLKKQTAAQKQISEQLQNENNLILKEQQKGNLADIEKINKAIQKQNELMLQLKQSESKTENKASENINLATLFEKLKMDNAIMVEYFSGVEKIYSFTIIDQKIQLNSFKNDSHVTVKIVQFIDFFNDANSIVNAPNDYNHYGNVAYELLKLPVNKTYTNLIIIPDGLLNFLPFEALITKPSATTNFAKMNYLLNDYNIGYENSAHFYLAENHTQNNSKQTILGIFPVFEKTEYELRFSKEELQSIRKKFEGKYLENATATFDNFKKNAHHYSILHLSTHASSGDIDTPSSIKFYDKEILYSELYSLNIRPNLVVLSACETGIGKLFKSEGAMSIARGFQFAGAQNLLFSLWKVNDYTTSVFMDLFYKNIKENQSYLQANANAKRDFLQDKNISNAKKSPYYWSAFVYYGSVDTSETNNYLFYSMIFIGGIGLLFGLIFFLSKRRIKNKRRS